MHGRGLAASAYFLGGIVNLPPAASRELTHPVLAEAYTAPMSETARFSVRTRDVVIALADVLGAHVALYDLEQGRVHEWRGIKREARSLEWRTRRGDASLLEGRGRCHAVAAVNDRWTLIVWTVGHLHPDAGDVADWGARLLGSELLSLHAEGTSTPPTGGGGGTSGSAEMGIPLWWAQRSQGPGELALLRGRLGRRRPS
jgi:hypothetical protein